VLRALLPLVAAAARADLVHVHFGYRLRDAEGLLGRTPVVLSLHGHDITAFHRQWPAYYRPVLPRVDAVVVPSQHLADLAVVAGARAERVHVLPSGVDLARHPPSPLPPGPPEVLFVGRFVAKKGVDVLLAAWPLVLARVPEARLRLLGTGPPPTTADPTVTVDPGGDVPGAVAAAMRAATVVCTPSRTADDGDVESLLLVNVEAQASGRPVVTTDSGGIPEHVAAGRAALVVPESDVGALAEALVTVLADRALAERLGAAGPGFAAEYDAAACARRVDDQVYRPLAD
jgi:glycosyltransferase involved in cell wall biosynthesis